MPARPGPSEPQPDQPAVMAPGPVSPPSFRQPIRQSPPSSPSPTVEGPVSGPAGRAGEAASGGARPDAGAGQGASPSSPPADGNDEPKKAPSGSSRGSSLVDLAPIREAVYGSTLAASQAAPDLLARDDIDDHLEVWIADEADAAGVADPVARIIGRRSGELGGGNPDLADGIGVLFALAGYATKQLFKLATAKRLRRGRHAAGVLENADQPAGEGAAA